ncbi:hypothetical protein MUK42_10575, partial [Musa troglodytarum]
AATNSTSLHHHHFTATPREGRRNLRRPTPTITWRHRRILGELGDRVVHPAGRRRQGGRPKEDFRRVISADLDLKALAAGGVGDGEGSGGGGGVAWRGDHDRGDGDSRGGGFSGGRGRGSRGGGDFGEVAGGRGGARGDETHLPDLGIADRPGWPSVVHPNAGDGQRMGDEGEREGCGIC